jgi:hypothetical protein
MKICKYPLVCLGLMVLLVSTCKAQKETTRIRQEQDSLFKYYFGILDSVAKANPRDTIYHCCIASTFFMELNTKIPSDAPGTIAGKMYFTKNNLIAWREWYDKHRRRKNQ